MSPLKRHTPPPEENIQFVTQDQADAMMNVGQVLNTSPIDSSEQIDIDPINPLADLAAKVQEHLRQNIADNSMSSAPKEAYETGGVTVTPPTDTKAYQGQLSPRDRDDLIGRMKAGTATKADLANIDESMIMDLPMIQASNFSIPGQYSPKPKDPAIRFRWVNCINALQSNMQRFLALGFVLATPDDVDQVKTPLADSMINGTQIKQYDVVLMKINVLQLMALYKKNVMDSLYKLDSVQRGGVAAASQSFMDDISKDPVARGQLASATYKRGGESPVTFTQN
jgi:hypothetical protein